MAVILITLAWCVYSIGSIWLLSRYVSKGTSDE